MFHCHLYCQGGHEGLADTDKSREQLYTEAKEILALVGSSSGGQDPAASRRPPSLQEPESPSSTAPRRPPRSKHDHSLGGGGGEEAAQLQPSAEAASRLLIGTVMLSKAAPAPALDTVKRERDRVLGEVNR